MKILECFVGALFFVLAPSSVWQILDQLLQIQLLSITSKFRIEMDEQILFKTKQNKTEIPINLPAPISPSISFNRQEVLKGQKSIRNIGGW